MAGGVLTNPIDAVRNQINAQNFFPVPNDPAAVNRLNTTAKMTAQIRGILDASIDRADLALEILDQAASGSALRYWTGLLHIDPSKERHTFLLILVVGKIGEFVAMGLKDHYKMRRPAQVYPWIMPLIDGPDTPSFPSSHSLQAHLISGALKLALQAPEFWPPAAWPPAAWPPGPSTGQTAKALDVLADRVARNREVAGVHYPMDSAAGYYAALYCLFLLRTKVVSFQNLVNNVKGELSDLP
jgi:PAP2 superfamily